MKVVMVELETKFELVETAGIRFHAGSKVGQRSMVKSPLGNPVMPQEIMAKHLCRPRRILDTGVNYPHEIHLL